MSRGLGSRSMQGEEDHGLNKETLMGKEPTVVTTAVVTIGYTEVIVSVAPKPVPG